MMDRLRPVRDGYPSLAIAPREAALARRRSTRRDEPVDLSRLVVEIVATHAAAEPGRVALIGDGRVISYRQLLNEAARLAGELRSAGGGPGGVWISTYSTNIFRSPRSLGSGLLASL